MKHQVMAVLGSMVICISGCATTKSLPPREELNQAVKKSLEATGLNYTSKTRVTHLSIPKLDGIADAKDKRLKYLGSGIDAVRGFSVTIDGAVDLKTKKSEVLYNLQYSKDNVDVSIKLPLLVDYDTQTVYIGTSFINTIIDTLYPQPPENRGKLLRININELLQENAADAPEFSKLINEKRFSAKNIEAVNSAFKTAILNSLAKLKDSSISEQPLTELDKKTGGKRRIQVQLGHTDSVALLTDLIDSVAHTLYQEGVISKKEYSMALVLTDKETVDSFINKFTMGMSYDVGVAQSGLVSNLVIRLNVADAEGNYQIGFENVSSFDGYNAPHFTINPTADNFFDFREVLKAIKAEKEEKAKKAKEQAESQPNEEIMDTPAVIEEKPRL
jgi:hypothetical protein